MPPYTIDELDSRLTIATNKRSMVRGAKKRFLADIQIQAVRGMIINAEVKVIATMNSEIPPEVVTVDEETARLINERIDYLEHIIAELLPQNLN